MKKRLLWATAGLIWAIGHGLFTAFITGGGHGNFLWLIAFLLGYVFGLLIPVTAFITADTEPFWVKVAGWSLVAVAVALTILSIDSQGPDMRVDIAESWGRSPVLFIFMSILHFVPIAFFVYRLIRSSPIKREEGSCII